MLVINAGGQKDSRRGEGGDVTSDLLCSEHVEQSGQFGKPTYSNWGRCNLSVGCVCSSDTHQPSKCCKNTVEKGIFSSSYEQCGSLL